MAQNGQSRPYSLLSTPNLIRVEIHDTMRYDDSPRFYDAIHKEVERFPNANISLYLAEGTIMDSTSVASVLRIFQLRKGINVIGTSERAKEMFEIFNLHESPDHPNQLNF